MATKTLPADHNNTLDLCLCGRPHPCPNHRPDNQTATTPTIPTHQIEANPDNPRTKVEASAEMVASVRSYGILLPLVVEPTGSDDGGYRLIDGHRRLAAAIEANLDTVPVTIRPPAAAESAIEMMLIANLHRQDLTPLEEAAAYQGLINLGRTQAQVSEMVGVTQSWVSKRLGLLKLPEVAQEAASKGRDSGGISMEEATALAALPKSKVASLFTGGQPTPWMVHNAVREHLNEKARARKVAELKKQGLPLVENLTRYYNPDDPQTLATIKAGGVELSALHWVDETEHQSEPCRVVSVSYRGQVIEGCSDPARHPRPATNKPAMKAGPAAAAPPARTAEQEAEQERLRRRWDLRVAGRNRRKAFAIDLLAGPVRTSDAVAFSSYLLTCNDGYELDVTAALELLAVDTDDDQRPDPVIARELIAHDQAFGTRFLLAAGLDIALVVIDDSIDEDLEPGDPGGEPARFALAWLESRGYELDELERHLLSGETAEEVVGE